MKKEEIVALLKDIGEVKQCPHCGGSGKCSCSSCGKYFSVWLCKACGGKGSAWVGPGAIHIHIYNESKKSE